MRRRVLTLVFLFSGAAAVWACSLNPQPLPPETADGGIDGSMLSGPDSAGGGFDAGNADTSPPPAGDASTDAAEDASEGGEGDAGDSGEGDALADAGEDG
jgi:hypothetical protein